MKKFLTVLTAGLASVFLFISVALAEDIKTDYFTLKLPSGWTLPQPAKEANGALFVVMQNASDNSMVSIAVTPVNLSAEKLAEATIENMKKGGITTSDAVASGRSYVAEFSQNQAKGVSYFTSNGKAGSVVTMLGDRDKAKSMLKKNLKPVDKNLFPSSY